MSLLVSRAHTDTHAYVLIWLPVAGSSIRWLDTPWCVLLLLMLDGAFEERAHRWKQVGESSRNRMKNVNTEPQNLNR